MRTDLTLLVVASLLAVVPACSKSTESPRELCQGEPATKGPWAVGLSSEGATVRWESRAAGCVEVALTEEAQPAESRVVEGEAKVTEVTVAYGEEFGFEPADEAGTFHLNEVRLTGLLPGRCYRYRVSSNPVGEGRVCTARLPGEGLRFVALGDTAVRWGEAQKLFTRVEAFSPDFVLHMGDIQYYASLLESWQSWFGEAGSLLRAAAFLPAVGNHELEIEGELGEYYERFFAPPVDDPSRGGPHWYTFSSGGLHFFSVSTEHPLQEGSAQRQWLDAALGQARQESGYRGSVVYLHKPLYTLAHHPPVLAIRASLDPLFRAHGVKLVLQAHNHCYERFEVEGLTYVTSGGGGAPLYPSDELDGEHPDDVPYRKAAHQAYELVELELEAQGLIGRAVGIDGEVLDSFSIAMP